MLLEVGVALLDVGVVVTALLGAIEVLIDGIDEVGVMAAPFGGLEMPEDRPEVVALTAFEGAAKGGGDFTSFPFDT